MSSGQLTITQSGRQRKKVAEDAVAQGIQLAISNAAQQIMMFCNTTLKSDTTAVATALTIDLTSIPAPQPRGEYITLWTQQLEDKAFVVNYVAPNLTVSLP